MPTLKVREWAAFFQLQVNKKATTQNSIQKSNRLDLGEELPRIELYQEKMMGQRGKFRALAGICHVHESYF